MTDRTANYTIEGFLYQFNKTLLEILEATDETEITVEGIIEDIEVLTDLKTNAIQCKYHASQDTYNLSILYKPILQMMVHFSKSTQKNINYKIFCHFPDKVSPQMLQISEDELNIIIGSQNQQLKKYIDQIGDSFDKTSFINCFRIEFGPSLFELECKLKQKMIDLNFDPVDVSELFYPNAIHSIAVKSSQKNEDDRKIRRIDFLSKIREIKSTTVSRWTLALYTKKQILAAKRKQLKTNLGINSRLRYFLLEQSMITDFDEQIVNFIKEYIDKYHFKPMHLETPLFCIDCDESMFEEISIRIFRKDILARDGYVSSLFDSGHFLKKPIITKKTREFDIRLLRFGNPSTLSLFNANKCDDFFAVTSNDYSDLDKQDLNFEHLQITSLSELKYIIGIRETYE